jgi:hypothetical protein
VEPSSDVLEGKPGDTRVSAPNPAPDDAVKDVPHLSSELLVDLAGGAYRHRDSFFYPTFPFGQSVSRIETVFGKIVYCFRYDLFKFLARHRFSSF